MSAEVPLPNPASETARVDSSAARRVLTRLGRAGQSPWLHQESARRMAERLDWIKRKPATVLDWSGNAGACTELLRATYPRAEHRRVSDSLNPVDVPRTGWWQRWRMGSDVAQVVSAQAVPPAWAGLVWSNMRLHFEADPLPMLKAWHDALEPDGFLMYSTLGPGSMSLLRAVYQSAGWGAPHADFVDMHDLGDMMVATGFAEPVMGQETLHLTYASAAALLSDLRAIGGNLSLRRFPGLRTRGWRAALERSLARQVDASGRIALEIELVYGHAFKAAAPSPRVEAQTHISVDEMRLMLRKDKRGK